MAVTDVTSLSITKFQLGVQVTKVTDSSADWSSVANNTYFYDKGDQLVHYKNSGGTVLELFSASGGLTYFTEAENSSGVNSTIFVDSLTAASSSTNADFAILPKGTGAILASVPNGLASGGNKRGSNSLDLQRVRSSATDVASGTSSILLGLNSSVSGSYSTCIGNANVNSGDQAVNVGGLSNTVSAAYASNFGGQINTASGNWSTTLGGSSNTASSTYSTTIGGNGNTASGYGSYAMGRGSNTFTTRGRQSRGQFMFVTGDCQKSEFFLGARTTDPTTTTLTTNGDADLTTAQIILANNSSYRFKGTIIGKQSLSTNTAAWDIDGIIVRGTSAATTSIVLSNINLVSNSPAWGTPLLTADTTNGALRVQVIGYQATNIQWTCIVETTEVIYA